MTDEDEYGAPQPLPPRGWPMVHALLAGAVLCRAGGKDEAPGSGDETAEDEDDVLCVLCLDLLGRAVHESCL